MQFRSAAVEVAASPAGLPSPEGLTGSAGHPSAAAEAGAAGAGPPHERLHLYTYSSRLEVYASQELWDSLDGWVIIISWG